MVARQWDGGEDDLAIVCDGSAALDRLHDRIARRFRRAEVRARAALPAAAAFASAVSSRGPRACGAT